ncbi:terpenoid cyclases/protein prenyltransferase alpha-alpha toroid [Pyronema omphalodes]|nr:terpenoid cyclases/protein prenyltransferase alpha-alpha toroid [Pyronema omphalodes]
MADSTPLVTVLPGPPAFDIDGPAYPPPETLNIPRHLKYWLRCTKTCLPEDYTPTDTNRMTLGCFSISALDLLGNLQTETTKEERNGWIDWLYMNQLPGGGFRGGPATNFAVLGSQQEYEGSKYDPVNLPACYFAIATLVAMGDDLERLDRRGLLQVLNRLQREDGSFGECLLKENGQDKVTAGGDMRFVYMASAVRWFLRGQEGLGCPEVPDFDVEKLVGYIKSAQGYDGGISDRELGESHAGMTYCAVAALSLLGRLEDGISNHEDLVRWLVQRQVPFEERHVMDDEEWADILATGTDAEKAAGIEIKLGADGKPIWAGFHGRCNKKADTCYSFWIGGTLSILKKLHLMDLSANRRFLLEKTRHIIGGFMKLPEDGGKPDILHSFLGLAALALMREEGLNSLDPALCISMQAKERLMELDWWKNGTL